MARPLGRHHDHVHVGVRHHLVVMDVEAVRECQRRTLLQIGLDVAVIDGGDGLVGEQHHHDIGAGHGLADFLDLEPGLLRLVPGSAALAQANRHLDARLAQILRMRMALRTIADDRDLAALDQR